MNVRVSKLLVCLVLGLGSLGGMPMRPEEIEELMSNMNQPTVVATTPQQSDKDDPIRKLLRLNAKMD